MRDNPYEELINTIYERLEGKGYAVYFYLPAADAAYPFIFIDRQHNIDIPTKTRQLGLSRVILHVYGEIKSRRGVVDILHEIKATIYELNRTEHFMWSASKIEETVMVDDSSNPLLWHGLVEAEIQYY